jgi:hypothetical protein
MGQALLGGDLAMPASVFEFHVRNHPASPGQTPGAVTRATPRSRIPPLPISDNRGILSAGSIDGARVPILSNQRQERFSQGLAKGKTADRAYVDAGFKPNRGNAARLKANESIRRRVAELQAVAVKKTAVTLQSLIEEAEEVRVAALKAGNHSAVVAAIKEKGILSGRRKTRQETKIVDEFENMTDDELLAFIAERQAVMSAALRQSRGGSPQRLLSFRRGR